MHPAISLPKGMNGVELRKKMCGFPRKFIGRPILEIVGNRQSIKKLFELGTYVLWLAELAAPLRNPDGANFPRPRVHILKEVWWIAM